MSGGEADRDVSIRRFPRRYAVGSAVVLVLLCVVAPVVIRSWSAGTLEADLMALLGLVVAFGCFLCVLLVCQCAAHYALKNKIERPLVWAILFLSPAVVIGGYFTYRSLPRSRARAILLHARLAPLPKSATEVRVYTWSSPLSGEEFLRFGADPDDIERFLDASPILRGKECYRLSAEDVKRPVGSDPEKWQRWREAQSRRDLSAPPWYLQEIRRPIRRYRIQPEGYHFPGEVLIEDQSNVVYVKLISS